MGIMKWIDKGIQWQLRITIRIDYYEYEYEFNFNQVLMFIGE